MTTTIPSRASFAVASAAALALALLAPAAAAADGSAGALPELELTLADAGGAAVELDAAAEEEIAAALLAYFAPCLPYGDVVADARPSPESLAAAWRELERGDHARLEAIAPADSRHHELRGRSFTLLVGLADERSPGATMTREPDGTVTSYAKCPGLEGLLLVCRIRELVPGVEMHEGCEQVRFVAEHLHNGRPAPEPADQ
jgi:hypothetical protein